MKNAIYIVAIIGAVYFVDQLFGSSSGDAPDVGSDGSSTESGTTWANIFVPSGSGTMSTLKSSIILPDDVSALIEKYAAMYGVDPNLAKAQAFYESGGKQSAKSKAGAVGVFQLLPSTAADLGVDPNSLEGNVQGGIKYLSKQLTKYNGDTTLALAAYNAGPGKVDKFGGVPPYLETQNYIKKILAAIGFGG